MRQFSNILDILYLPRIITTLISVIFQPVQFFTKYNELVKSRKPNLFDINYEKNDDKYLGPVKFSALAIGINNLLLPAFLELGLAAGAITQNFYNFSQWAQKEGYLNSISITGIYIVDNIIADIISLATIYTLGVLIWLYSSNKISIRFTTGYFFYLNAWGLLATLTSMTFILIGLITPIYTSGIPQLINTGIQFAGLFMFLIFPIAFWPKIIGVERKTIAIAHIAALISWIILIALIAPMIIKMPQF